MGDLPSYLEFHLRLKHGGVSRFTSGDPLAIAHILGQVQRGKVFSLPSLVVADSTVVHVFPGPSVTRIDLLMDAVPETLRKLDFDADGAEWVEIPEEEWRECVERQREDRPDRGEILGEEGTYSTPYGRIQMSDGEVACFEFRLRLPNLIEQRKFLHTVFTQPGFPFMRRGGGVGILNPSQIVHCTFHPGAVPPADAWAARPLSGGVGEG